MPQPARHRPSSRRPARRGPGHRPRWGLRLATAAAALVLLASGVGHALVDGLQGGLHRVNPFAGIHHRPDDSGGGLTFLVVGVDDRGALSAKKREKYRLGGAACECTDTLMMVHVSEDRERISVVSIPRDSYVVLPPHTDPDSDDRHTALPAKINSAFAHGGPHLTVRAVEKSTGVHIDHYLEIDFTSFMRTVDVLGGVKVCSVRPLKDRYSGLDLPAGTSKLNGAQALAYVRARHLDGDSDLGRMRRQQRFIAAVIDKATSSGVLTNPVRLGELADSLVASVRTDKGFGTAEMMALGEAMRGFSAASSEFVSVPVANVNYVVPGVGSTVKWDDEKAAELFASVREDRPLAEHGSAEDAEAARRRPGAGAPGSPSPGTPSPGAPGSPHASRAPGATVVEVPPGRVRVQVDNGTLRNGLAHRTDRALRDMGFVTTGLPRNHPRHDVEQTVITYDPRWGRSVRTLAAALPGATLRRDPGRGPVMRVTLGADFGGVHGVRAAAPSAADPGPAGGAPGAVTGDEVTCP